MDNSLIVALTSVATVAVTGLITLASKYIDSIQKKGEQAMLIRSDYIKKKIEAAQIFVVENNIRTASRLLMRRYLLSLKSHVGDGQEIVVDFKAVNEKIDEMTLTKESYWPLYFDISHAQEKIMKIIDEFNEIMPLIDPGSVFCNNDNYYQNVDKAIGLVDKLLEVHNEMNGIVRQALANYDVI